MMEKEAFGMLMDCLQQIKQKHHLTDIEFFGLLQQLQFELLILIMPFRIEAIKRRGIWNNIDFSDAKWL